MTGPHTGPIKVKVTQLMQLNKIRRIRLQGTSIGDFLNVSCQKSLRDY